MRVLLTGGGTGGHIYPALTIANRLKERIVGVRLLYVGTRDGLEADLVPREGIPFETITVRGLLGKTPVQLLSGFFAAARGCAQSYRIVRRFRPDVVVGTGGYVCGPVVLVAALCRIPILLQEQNAFPGLTNRALARFASVVAVPFDDTRSYFPRRTRVVVTGNPVRPQILSQDRAAAARALGLDPDKLTLFVFGGSRGAKSINQAMIGAVRTLLSRKGLQILYVTGREYFHWVTKELEGQGIGKERYGNLSIVPYLYQVEKAWATTDLVVSRAGGMTLAEICALGIPAVLIPSPNVANDHQRANAQAVARHGGAVVLDDRDLNGELLARTVVAILDEPGRLAVMAEASRAVGRPRATDDLVDWVQRLSRGRSKGLKGVE